MSAFKKVALLRSHQILPNLGKEYISDLVELASLAAVIRDQVEDVAIPVGSVDRDPLGAFRRYGQERKSRSGRDFQFYLWHQVGFRVCPYCEAVRCLRRDGRISSDCKAGRRARKWLRRCGGPR